jgi:penicillin-binding protein 1A
MASAFSTFATGGIQYSPFGIWRVEDAYGQVLEEHLISGTKTLDAQISYQVVDMMQGVVEQGSGRVVRQMGFTKPAAGKTGTSNGYNDAWFTGFTPTLSVSVWVGYDHPKEMRDAHGAGITGGRGAAPIWARFMIKATEGDPARPFVQPAGIRMQTCDSTSGRPVSPDDPDAVQVVIRESAGFDTVNRW